MPETEEQRLERELNEKQEALNDVRARPFASLAEASETAKTDPAAFNKRFDALSATGKPLYESKKED